MRIIMHTFYAVGTFQYNIILYVGDDNNYIQTEFEFCYTTWTTTNTWAGFTKSVYYAWRGVYLCFAKNRRIIY